tara:strand:+ start:439 stop:621 length:183 start_codon:yes stop_codon:yes gene_type:complete
MIEEDQGLLPNAPLDMEYDNHGNIEQILNTYNGAITTVFTPSFFIFSSTSSVYGFQYRMA